MKARIGLACLALMLGGCVTSVKPPHNTSDACAILDEKARWEDHIFDAARSWGVSPGTILAFMRQESSFRHNARPVDRNGRPLSSALGYSQALEGTWADYERSQGRGKRKSFEDSADFIGWYLDRINKQTGIAKTDSRALYLAYHEGPGGYRRGSYATKPWLLQVATRVGTQASLYDTQLRGCERRQMRRLSASLND
jgi:hypothetical protein